MDTGSASHSSATAVVISSATAANTSATVATAAVDPSLLSNATASLNLGLDTAKNKKKKKSATYRLSGAEKIDNVHKSLAMQKKVFVFSRVLRALLKQQTRIQINPAMQR